MTKEGLSAALEGDAYLKKHMVPELLDELVKRLLAEKPDEPRELVRSIVEKWTYGECSVPVAPAGPNENPSPRKKPSLKSGDCAEAKKEEVDEKKEEGEAKKEEAKKEEGEVPKEEAKKDEVEASKGEAEAKKEEGAPEEKVEAKKDEGEAKEPEKEVDLPPLDVKVIAEIHSNIRWAKKTPDELLEMFKTLDASPLQAVKAKDPKNGNQALHIAAQNGHMNLVKFLVDSRADLSGQNGKGQTALHMSVEYDFYFQTKFLVESGASKDIENGDGNKAITGIDGQKTGLDAWDSPGNILKAAVTKEEIEVALDVLEKADPSSVDKGQLAQTGMLKKKGPAKAEWEPFHAKFMEIVKKL